jgi:hypothetical protein
MADFAIRPRVPCENDIRDLPRRSFLAVSFATVAAGSVLAPAMASADPTPHQASQIGWERVKTAYLTAEDAIHTHDHGNLTGASPEACKQADDAFSAVCFRRDEAVVALMEFPATHASMVAYKMGLIINDERWECRTFEQEMAAIHADLIRIGGAA